MRPSEVPGCPETNKDCGQCSCASWQKLLRGLGHMSEVSTRTDYTLAVALLVLKKAF